MRLKYRIKASHRRIRRMRGMRGFVWRGFKVTLYNNHSYDFRFEWKMVPLGSSMLRLTKWNGKYHKLMHDPTSMRFLSGAKDGAKEHINEMRSPFYLRRH